MQRLNSDAGSPKRRFMDDGNKVMRSVCVKKKKKKRKRTGLDGGR